MIGRYLLDTNILIALLNQDETIREQISLTEEVFIPSTALGELYYGALKSGRPQHNLQRIFELESSSMILNCDAETARVYGTVKHQLREKGKPIPENDIWIAATAIRFNLSLVSRDDHFIEVEGLDLKIW